MQAHADHRTALVGMIDGKLQLERAAFEPDDITGFVFISHVALGLSEDGLDLIPMTARETVPACEIRQALRPRRARSRARHAAWLNGSLSFLCAHAASARDRSPRRPDWCHSHTPARPKTTRQTASAPTMRRRTDHIHTATDTPLVEFDDGLGPAQLKRRAWARGPIPPCDAVATGERDSTGYRPSPSQQSIARERYSFSAPRMTRSRQSVPSQFLGGTHPQRRLHRP